MMCYEPNTAEQSYAAKYPCENFKDTDVESFEIYYPHAAGSHCLSIWNKIQVCKLSFACYQEKFLMQWNIGCHAATMHVVSSHVFAEELNEIHGRRIVTN